jgi:hypothetical protein
MRGARQTPSWAECGWRAPDTDKVDGDVDRERRLELGRERERLGVFASVHVVRERQLLSVVWRKQPDLRG